MEIRYATAADAIECNNFHNEHYGTERTLEQWMWEFSTPTTSGDLPLVVAVADGEIVGTQGYIPVRFIDERGPFLTAKSEETLISTKMRGKSLLRDLYEPLFEHARTRDCMSIWGFTPAEAAFRRLGFDIPAQTGQLFQAISPSSLLDLAGSDGGRSPFRARAIEAAGVALALWSRLAAMSATGRLASDERLVTLDDAGLFDEAYNRRFITNWSGATILRDRDYMQWRVFENPYLRANVVAIVREGALQGHIAFALGEDGTGYLVDVMAASGGGRENDARLASILLAEAIRRLKRLGATCIRGWTLNDHPFDRLVRRAAVKLGFVVVRRGSAVVFNTRFQPQPRGTSHDEFSNWYVTRLFMEGVTG